MLPVLFLRPGVDLSGLRLLKANPHHDPKTGRFTRSGATHAQLLTLRDFLRGQPVAQIQRGVIAAKPGERGSDAAYRWLAENPQQPVKREGIGVIVFDRKGLEDSLRHKFGWQKLNAVAAIPEVIQRGMVIDRSADRDGKPLLNTHLAAPITIDGERYQMVVRLRKNAQEGEGAPNRFYLHEVGLEKEVVAGPTKTGEIPTESQAIRTGDPNHIRRILHEALNFNPGDTPLGKSIQLQPCGLRRIPLLFFSCIRPVVTASYPDCHHPPWKPHENGPPSESRSPVA